MGRRPNLLVLGTQDFTAWEAAARTETRPGGSLPYGLDRLRSRFDLRWTDGQSRGPWARMPGRALGSAARRFAPGLQGLAIAGHGLRLAGQVDAALSVFENAGLGFAAAQRLLPSLRSVPHVMMVCWLAEDMRTMSAAHRRSVRSSIRDVRKLLVFSENQVQPLTDEFGLDPGVVVRVPFGVDTDYYDASLLSESPGGGGIVAVGSDSRRDYETLFEAVARSNIEITVACQPRNIEGLVVPPQVTIATGVYDEDYRRLLHRADLVVTATTAPAYPSGQSVVLEAMSMGRPTLTTDSLAMRDYVEHGVHGDLVAPADADALAGALLDLAADEARRSSLAIAGRDRVRAEFSLGQIWSEVARLLSHEVSDDGARPWL